ncbi:hypothetical protein CCR80_10225 [Rhodothalassium salexigens]|uniref:YraN family protein n=1 Tax=Rhodothalassium salexigens TaxID=1086 RepID=UPI0019146094|nr:YraN family protein [Rhodothalassium salexigens]MBK5921404.1 hypothetical protein [Rhodothalassium salexigens]
MAGRAPRHRAHAPRHRDRKAAEARGRRAERWAAWWLRLKGYRLVERRFRTPVGEVDLIVAKGPVLAFVEVKHRRALAHLPDSLNARQRDRVARAALAYMAGNPTAAGADIRFDLVLVGRWPWPRHIPGAWRPRAGL